MNERTFIWIVKIASLQKRLICWLNRVEAYWIDQRDSVKHWQWLVQSFIYICVDGNYLCFVRLYFNLKEIGNSFNTTYCVTINKPAMLCFMADHFVERDSTKYITHYLLSIIATNSLLIRYARHRAWVIVTRLTSFSSRISSRVPSRPALKNT